MNENAVVSKDYATFKKFKNSCSDIFAQAKTRPESPIPKPPKIVPKSPTKGAERVLENLKCSEDNI